MTKLSFEVFFFFFLSFFKEFLETPNHECHWLVLGDIKNVKRG